jgi:hypothetical protein
MVKVKTSNRYSTEVRSRAVRDALISAARTSSVNASTNLFRGLSPSMLGCVGGLPQSNQPGKMHAAHVVHLVGDHPRTVGRDDPAQVRHPQPRPVLGKQPVRGQSTRRSHRLQATSSMGSRSAIWRRRTTTPVPSCWLSGTRAFSGLCPVNVRFAEKAAPTAGAQTQNIRSGSVS